MEVKKDNVSAEETDNRGTPLSIGLGITNECDLDCAHCYRATDGAYRLSPDDIKTVCESVPVGSVAFGTGESALHPQFLEILDYLRRKRVKLTMASNGYSLNALPDDYLPAFHDVEVSIDFPSEQEQDDFRGSGNWRAVREAIERCHNAGVEVSILATLMSSNYDKMDRLTALAGSVGCNLRVNAYQPVKSGRFTLSYEQFWEGYRRLFSSSRLLSCSEPVVCAVLGLGPAVSPCGHKSIRITPDGRVTPCVYWPGSSLRIDDLRRLGQDILNAPEFKDATRTPPSATDCPCRGGCASRRALSGALDAHDAYCPWTRGSEIRLQVTYAGCRELTRSSHVCTTILDCRSG